MRRVEGHRLQGVRQAPSPNFDERPQGVDDISLLVIHGITLPPGQYGGPDIENLFLNRLDPNKDPYFAQIIHLKVSTHVLIRRDGDVVQFVPFDKRAWHAGKSSFEGRETCNDFSIGIELEGTDDEAYDERQYPVLAEVTAALLKAYPRITPERIQGHSDIAPGRKTDPGPFFDWAKFRGALASL